MLLVWFDCVWLRRLGTISVRVAGGFGLLSLLGLLLGCLVMLLVGLGFAAARCGIGVGGLGVLFDCCVGVWCLVVCCCFGCGCFWLLRFDYLSCCSVPDFIAPGLVGL